MNGAVNALVTTVSADSLWGVFSSAIPYIAVVVLFAFGYKLVTSLLKGISTHKYKRN